MRARYKVQRLARPAIEAMRLLLLPLLVCSRDITPADVSLGQYSAQGELVQLRYAGRAVERAPPVVGLSGKLGDQAVSVLLRLRGLSPLSRDAEVLPSFEVLDDVLLCSAGYAPDCRAVLVQAAVITQSHRLLFGDPPSAEHLCGELLRWMTRGLRRDEREAVVRPLAVSVLVCDIPKGGLLSVLGNGGETQRRPFVCLGAVSRAAMRAMLTGTAGLGPGEAARTCVSLLLEQSSESAVDVAVVLHSSSKVALRKAVRSGREAMDFVTRVIAGDNGAGEDS